MAILPTELSSLELTIASLSTYHSLPHRQPGSTVEGLDMNKTPTEIEEDWTSEATEHQDENIPRNKKLRLTTEQSRILEETFKEHQTLNPKQKEALSCILKLRPRQVEVWFQNRRARTKSKQTEMECEYLKRYFGTLSEENKRLQREIEELRSVKFPSSSIFDSGTNVDPSRQGSSLTMCPRCTRITATSVASNPKHLQLL